MRRNLEIRKTRETDITVDLNIDGSGRFEGSSGIGFFDHMINTFCVHGNFDLILKAVGDLNVDCHHTVEDIGILLGRAFNNAIGDKSGITRYGNAVIPMDDALTQAVVDISGRPFLVFNASFSVAKIGDLDSETVIEFFRAFVFNAGITLHVNLLYGENTHHCIESVFKAVSHSLKQAVTEKNTGILSTKGSLQ